MLFISVRNIPPKEQWNDIVFVQSFQSGRNTAVRESRGVKAGTLEYSEINTHVHALKMELALHKHFCE